MTNVSSTKKYCLHDNAYLDSLFCSGIFTVSVVDCELLCLLDNSQNPGDGSRFKGNTKQISTRTPNLDMVYLSPLTRESSSTSINTSLKGDESNSYPSKKRVRRRRVTVTFDDRQNVVTRIPSVNDLTCEEHSAYFYQRHEYTMMRDDAKQTIIKLLNARSSGLSDTTAFNEVMLDDSEEVCVRGLEYLADDFVSTHRKRARLMSMSAVFTHQDFHRSCQGNSSPYDMEGMAQAYQTYTVGCQEIAKRWGHFDAIDAAGTSNDLKMNVNCVASDI